MISGHHHSFVTVREEKLKLPTYLPLTPEPNPMFLDERVNQGSSGRVYPNPLTDGISNEKTDHSWRAVYLENEYLRLTILPELGGRIHAAIDKTNNYDFIYEQHVIKPALIGLLGPWISGGLEFNWPQHHRPSTFMPVSYCIEEGPDGSKTVWLSEHDPFDRTKGMVGIRLRPGIACIETITRIYNRSAFAVPFLWWHNTGVHANRDYQVFFPPDVHSITYHARRFMNSFPIAKGNYDMADFGEGADISWVKNSNLPSSYFANTSKYDFFGGYDHGRQAGIVHIANHHISPGKKFFTWGFGDVGLGWYDELTDEDGPYLELMAGTYTDNQPDFTWLHPYETKTFCQFWYPIQKIGPAQNANLKAAVSLNITDQQVRIGLCVTRILPDADIILTARDKIIKNWKSELVPGDPFIETIPLPEGAGKTDIALRVLDEQGQEIIYCIPEPDTDEPVPEPLEPPSRPEEIKTNEELCLVGTHLEQYLHPRWNPEPYYEEALKRDPCDSRANMAMGRLRLKRGEFKAAEENFRTAIQRLTRHNNNPADGEPFYQLGLALWYQERLGASPGSDRPKQYQDAYSAFYKAVWAYAWQSAGYFLIAQIDSRNGSYETALRHLDRALAVNSCSLKARCLKSAILRKLGKDDKALEIIKETLSFDPLDQWALYEQSRMSRTTEPVFLKAMRGDAQNYLDLAFDYINAGFYAEAVEALGYYKCDPEDSRVHPMALYVMGYAVRRMGEYDRAMEIYRKAASMPPDYCFPSRLDEELVLRDAISCNPNDARAHYYLGNLLFDKKRGEEALLEWEKSTRLDPAFSSIPWRNLGIACYNVRSDLENARKCYEQASALNPDDPRLLIEIDMLSELSSVSPEERLANLEKNKRLVEKSDTLLMKLVCLYNVTGRPEKTLEALEGHIFHPWEGGESPAMQYVQAHYLLGKQALQNGDPKAALAHFEKSLDYPPNLRGGRLRPTPDVHIDFHAALALDALGRHDEAKARLIKASEGPDDLSDQNYYRALALRRLGNENEACSRLESLLARAVEERSKVKSVDFFEPYSADFAVFKDDAVKRNRLEYTYIIGLAQLGLGKRNEAEKSFRDITAAQPHHPGAVEHLQDIIFSKGLQ